MCTDSSRTPLLPFRTLQEQKQDIYMLINLETYDITILPLTHGQEHEVRVNT